MFPHERSLVKQLAGKPFVLLGINGDDNDPKLKTKNEKRQITWRSFKNAQSGKPSHSDDWNLEGWPTLYLIDHQGIIRKKWVGSPGEKIIDQSIEELVAAMEKTSTGK
jgi:hypothetical protein